jgi:hypothetical protein
LTCRVIVNSARGHWSVPKANAVPTPGHIGHSPQTLIGSAFSSRETNAADAYPITLSGKYRPSGDDVADNSTRSCSRRFAAT